MRGTHGHTELEYLTRCMEPQRGLVAAREVRSPKLRRSRELRMADAEHSAVLRMQLSPLNQTSDGVRRESVLRELQARDHPVLLGPDPGDRRELVGLNSWSAFRGERPLRARRMLRLIEGHTCTRGGPAETRPPREGLRVTFVLLSGPCVTRRSGPRRACDVRAVFRPVRHTQVAAALA